MTPEAIHRTSIRRLCAWLHSEEGATQLRSIIQSYILYPQHTYTVVNLMYSVMVRYSNSVSSKHKIRHSIPAGEHYRIGNIIAIHAESRHMFKP